MRPFLFLACLSVALGACGGDAAKVIGDAYEAGGEAAVKAASTALNAECKRNIDNRKEFVAEINQRQLDRGKTPRAKAQDCDGDGQSDF